MKDALTPTDEQMARKPILRGGLPTNPVSRRLRSGLTETAEQGANSDADPVQYGPEST